MGLVSQEQLYDLGFSVDQIRRRVRQGHLHPIFHRVYAVGHRQIVPRAHLLAALLSCGPDAVLSHRSAAAVHGLRSINTHDIHVTLPTRGVRSQPGITVHRTAAPPHPDDLRTSVNLRVSSPMRMLTELAAHETPVELERLITGAVRKRLLRPDAADGRAAIEAALARHLRFHGRRRLTDALDVYRRTESHASQLELAFDAFLNQHPELPDPQRNVDIDHWEIDRYWPEHRLAVELDGRPYHVAAADMERDRLKDTHLQRIGCTPIRITDFRFAHDRPGILRDLCHFLRAVAD